MLLPRCCPHCEEAFGLGVRLCVAQLLLSFMNKVEIYAHLPELRKKMEISF